MALRLLIAIDFYVRRSHKTVQDYTGDFRGFQSQIFYDYNKNSDKIKHTILKAMFFFCFTTIQYISIRVSEHGPSANDSSQRSLRTLSGQHTWDDGRYRNDSRYRCSSPLTTVYVVSSSRINHVVPVGKVAKGSDVVRIYRR